MAESITKITKLPELIKLEYTLFVLPFTYIGMLFAGIPTILQFLLITVALVCARGAAFSANRYFGWNYDIRNPKKINSPSVRNYHKNELFAVFLLFAIIFMTSAYLLNYLAFALAPLIILLIVLEPHAKKYTEHRHLSMGLIIGLAIPGGYIGMAGRFPLALPIYILLAGYAFFSAGNDIIYTINHRDFDKKEGLKTYPTKYRVKKALNISILYHVAAAALFIIFGVMLNSIFVVLGAELSYIILMTEHRNLDHKDSDSLRISFFNYNIAVSIVLLLAFAAFTLTAI